ncbi:MAG: hypothetical protein OEX08_02440 [Candidatus Nomurabacteria bacterium]|nr:hypothetical protein [Candidatus Nomurabacteria bacterium]
MTTKIQDLPSAKGARVKIIESNYKKDEVVNFVNKLISDFIENKISEPLSFPETFGVEEKLRTRALLARGIWYSYFVDGKLKIFDKEECSTKENKNHFKERCLFQKISILLGKYDSGELYIRENVDKDDARDFGSLENFLKALKSAFSGTTIRLSKRKISDFYSLDLDFIRPN